MITLDLDPTGDPAHGAQQLTFFNWYYDTYCSVGILRRLIERLREAFPKAKIRVRLDGGFAAPSFGPLAP